ncbi:unnamed protein product [Paramecium sonneborni]|uniref:Uncharacterized protein n=1 Tax=Paramecium sonneborni TaxID=65129 RepID=A0A8S1LFD6_9CILI|nr:unnamed protein product [Paramecium sonneborni]
MDSNFSQQIVEKIDSIYSYIVQSGNKDLIQKTEQKKDEIYAAIPKPSSKILSNMQIQDYIKQYLNNFINYVSVQGNLQQQGWSKFFRQSEKTKILNIFVQKFNKLPKYFKSLEMQDLSVSTFINDQDLVHSKVPFNFTANSHLLDSEIDYTVCITLIFKDLCDGEVFSHTLNVQKLMKKIPILKQFEFLKTLQNYLLMTVQQNRQIFSLQSLDSIVHFSPKIKDYQNNSSQQNFYLIKDMEIILSPTYRIKVVDVFSTESNNLNQNYINKNEKYKYDDQLLIQNAKNYIILQPLEDKIYHDPITIYDLKKSIIINNFLKMPNEICAQILFDGIGYIFEVLKEKENFYTSLQYKGQVDSMTKNMNFCIVIGNELRIQIDSEGGQLFFDQTEYQSNLFL